MLNRLTRLNAETGLGQFIVLLFMRAQLSFSAARWRYQKMLNLKI